MSKMMNESQRRDEFVQQFRTYVKDGSLKTAKTPETPIKNCQNQAKTPERKFH